MRALLIGLVGVLAIVGGAEAGECRVRHMAFVSGGKTFQVVKTSHTVSKVNGLFSEKTIFRGRVGQVPYIIDIRGLQGNSTTFDSYRGQVVKAGIGKLNWSSTAQGWTDGAQMMINAGSLRGDWRAVCE